MLHNHFPSIQQPRSNHEPTILRVEYKNDTISTKPSYISDSPNQTAIQPHSNLNQKKLAQDRPFRVLCRRSAARRPRKDRISASRSLPCPRRPAPYPRRKDRDSSYVIPIAADLHRSTSCDLAAQGSSRCSSGNLIAAHQRNRAVLLLVVEEESTVRKPTDKVIAPVLLDNPVLYRVESYQKLGYSINFTVSIRPFILALHGLPS